MKDSLTKFIGSKAAFGVSDPWDFCKQHGDKEYAAAIKAVSEDSLLLELSASVSYEGVAFEYLVATARHEDKNLADMTATNAVPVNLTPAIVQNGVEATTENLFNAAKAWRSWHLVGGLGLK